MTNVRADGFEPATKQSRVSVNRSESIMQHVAGGKNSRKNKGKIKNVFRQLIKRTTCHHHTTQLQLRAVSSSYGSQIGTGIAMRVEWRAVKALPVSVSKG